MGNLFNALNDLKTNDTSFSIGIDGQENYSKIEFFVKKDAGEFSTTTESQTISSDGTYKYKAEVTDLAGNSSTTPVQEVIIETAEGTLKGFRFLLSLQKEDEFKNCWMTDAVIPFDILDA